MEQAKGVCDVVAVSYPTDTVLSYRELTNFVLEKLENVEGNYIIVGESFSGPVSLFVSQSKPVGFVGLVLVATFIRAPNLKIGKYLPWRIGFNLTKPLYSLRLALSKPENGNLISNISTEMQTVSPHVLSARIGEIFAVDASDALRKCHVPIVYFRGTKDIVVLKKNLGEILSVNPDVKVVEFADQHFLLQSSPERAFAEIRTFAADCA